MANNTVNGISILVPVYNFSIIELWNSLLPALKKTDISHEIIFMDDCSSDKELSEKNSQFVSNQENTNYILLEKNIGRASIRNELAEKSQYEHLLFIDVDSKITDGNFICNYLENSTKASILVGGTCYCALTNPTFSLRYYYGKAREEVSANTRNKKPYDTLTLNNIFIEKQIYQRFKLDETFKQYGHEDTKFGYDLKHNAVSILHLDNPVEHIGLEENHVFLDKTRKGVENFAVLVQQGFGTESKFFSTYNALKRYRLLGVFNAVYKLFSKRIIRNLNSEKPSIRLFDVFKLKAFVDLMRK